jgi:hypothetical protein
MLDNVTITFSGSAAAISQLLATVAHSQPATASGAGGDLEEPYSAPNSGPLVSLDRAQFAAFFEGMDPRYQEGVRLIWERGGSVAWRELEAKGIRSPGHFKSRTSLRARKVLRLNGRVQFASYFQRTENGEQSWHLKVTPTTLASMKAYFAASGMAADAAKSAKSSKGKRG